MLVRDWDRQATVEEVLLAEVAHHWNARAQRVHPAIEWAVFTDGRELWTNVNLLIVGPLGQGAIHLGFALLASRGRGLFLRLATSQRGSEPERVNSAEAGGHGLVQREEGQQWPCLRRGQW